MIYPTKLDYGDYTDTNYRKLIEVYNMIFPLSIEEKYVELVNAVSEYFDNYRELSTNQFYINENSSKIQELTSRLGEEIKQKEQYTQEKNTIDKQLIEAIQSKDYSDIKRLAEKAEELSNKIKKLEIITQNKIDTTRESIIDSHINANDSRHSMGDSINKIKEILLDINNLPNGGVNRMDGFKITQKHIDIINSLDCSDETKKVFLITLASQLKLRVAAFKCYQQYATLLLEQYKNRSPMVYDDNKNANIGIAFNGLMDYELADHIFSKNFDWNNPLVIDYQYANALGADMTADYLNKGVIDEKEVEEYRKYRGNVYGQALAVALQMGKVISEDGSLHEYYTSKPITK